MILRTTPASKVTTVFYALSNIDQDLIEHKKIAVIFEDVVVLRGGWQPRREEDESSAGERGREETTAAHGHSVRE